ncbi:hypothetical protein N7541_007381 [Penicillium brevicompactum]|uniref:Uncharacterized protein n=1 Tax=Penicillium brevicompactum TaxID=5074 RepID=A0A9W9R005_PENBR|nr:hypothetical protein N7541_007381 [Penicillium brevicompactum]
MDPQKARPPKNTGEQRDRHSQSSNMIMRPCDIAADKDIPYRLRVEFIKGGECMMTGIPIPGNPCRNKTITTRPPACGPPAYIPSVQTVVETESAQTSFAR